MYVKSVETSDPPPAKYGMDIACGKKQYMITRFAEIHYDNSPDRPS